MKRFFEDAEDNHMSSISSMSSAKSLHGSARVRPIVGAALKSALADRKADESESFVFCTNSNLRAAIRNNAVTFPAQMAHLRSRADDDRSERIVHLYFVGGWPVRRICARYRLGRQTIYTILAKWRQRAVAAGFVQEIQRQSGEGEPAESLTPTAGGAVGTPCISDIYQRPRVVLVKTKEVVGPELAARSTPDSDFTGSVSAWEGALSRRAPSTRAHL
jgi:hypothetical protein